MEIRIFQRFFRFSEPIREKFSLSKFLDFVDFIFYCGSLSKSSAIETGADKTPAGRKIQFPVIR